MYSHFKGNIEEIFEDRIILDVNDIGYEIYMPESEILSLKEEKNKIKIYTYLHVREDDMKLFGFKSSNNLNFFKKLINVSGVGPKMAQKIIFELKDKVQKEDLTNITEKENIKVKNAKNINEAITALEVLGYSKHEITGVIERINISDEKVEDIIRLILKEMQK